MLDTYQNATVCACSQVAALPWPLHGSRRGGRMAATAATRAHSRHTCAQPPHVHTPPTSTRCTLPCSPEAQSQAPHLSSSTARCISLLSLSPSEARSTMSAAPPLLGPARAPLRCCIRLMALSTCGQHGVWQHEQYSSGLLQCGSVAALAGRSKLVGRCQVWGLASGWQCSVHNAMQVCCRHVGGRRGGWPAGQQAAGSVSSLSGRGVGVGSRAAMAAAVIDSGAGQ